MRYGYDVINLLNVLIFINNESCLVPPIMNEESAYHLIWQKGRRTPLWQNQH